MIEVRNLIKSYSRSGIKIPVLQGVSFELRTGETLAVVGASGIGKSTLLHCLGLLDRIDEGEILFDGKEIAHESSETIVLNRRRKIGFVFQFHYLMAELSALENVMVPLLLERTPTAEAQSKAEDWLQRVGLSNRLMHKPAELSGGEQQRVALSSTVGSEAWNSRDLKSRPH